MTKGKTAIVILNWNGIRFLRKYLPVLLEKTPREYARIIVADNGSSDGSAEWLLRHYPQETESILFDRNWGFTGGYNRAFAQLGETYDYFLLLNSDIRVSDRWLEPLIDFMDTHPRAGICMPKILSESDPARFEYAGACGGYLDRFGFPFCRGRILSRTEPDCGQYDSPEQIFWASGAAMLVRSSLYRQLGGLDESFFAHMEEIDFCWRAQLLGHQIWAVPQSKIYHVGGGTLPNDSPRKLYLNYRNNLLMLYKNLPEGKKRFPSPEAEVPGNRPETASSPLRAAGPDGIPAGWEHRNRMIFVRKCIDGLSAAAYLLQGKPSYAKAVWNAHRDFEKMKGGATVSPRLPQIQIAGCYPGSIIYAFFTGRKTFSRLRFR